jgi:PKD repeat protein
LIITSSAALALVWEDPYWLPVGTHDPNMIEFGESARAATGGFSSIDRTVTFRAELLTVFERPVRVLVDDETVDISRFTGYETVSLSESDYGEEGLYTLRFTITDSRGPQIKNLHLNVLPGEEPTPVDTEPEVTLTATPRSGPEGTTVELRCEVEDGEAPFFYEINFGDSSPSARRSLTDRIYSPTHVYETEGVYTVTCTVRDEDGDSDSATARIIISETPTSDTEPEVTLTATPSTGPEGTTVNFRCDVVNGEAPFEYVINFGDGSAVERSTRSTRRYFPVHAYEREGSYTAKCTVTDEDGDSDSASVRIAISETPTPIDTEPEVTLTAAPRSGPEGTRVDFRCDVAAGESPFQYELNFGDGSPAERIVRIGRSYSSSHIYEREGSYDATCSVRDSDGDSDSARTTITISETPTPTDTEPEVTLTAAPRSGPEGTRVIFRCEVAAGEAPFKYEINFGDSSAVERSTRSTRRYFPAHTYERAGLYTATCTVTDEDSDSDSDSENIKFSAVVSDTEPVAGFDFSPLSPVEGDKVFFTDTSASDEGIVSWFWNFDDGFTSDVQNPEHVFDHVFDAKARYNVCLTVAEADGDEDTACREVIVKNNIPFVDLIASPTEGTVPLDVKFFCSAEGGNAPYDVELNFGDGFTNEGDSARHTYDLGGDYDAFCTVVDADGDLVSDMVEIRAEKVVREPAEIGLVVLPLEGEEPLEVFAKCTSTDPDMEFTLDFDDGTVIADSAAYHTYDENGVYKILCLGRDLSGIEFAATETVEVNDSAFSADFVWKPDSPLAGELILFTPFYPDVYDEVVEWAWDFGDGSVSDIEFPEHIFEEAGEYLVTLIATDSDGSVASNRHVITVSDAEIDEIPEAELSVDPVDGVEPLEVSFTCSGSGGDGALVYEIDFGDGSLLGEEREGNHTYLENGFYLLNCTVRDEDGDFSSASLEIEVFDSIPGVVIDWSPDSPAVGERVSIEAVVDSYDSVVSYEWEIGDEPAFIGDRIIEYIFREAGDYEIAVTVRDDDGSIGKANRTITVSDEVPVEMDVDFSWLPAAPEADEEVVFTAVVDRNESEILVYSWDFNDSTTLETDMPTVSHTFDVSGDYNVTLSVLSADGESAGHSEIVSVEEPSSVVLDADFTYTPAAPIEGEVVVFEDVSVHINPLVSFEWDFDDGTFSDEQNISHIFASAGDYNVCLSVADSEDNMDTECNLVSVGAAPFEVELTANVTEGIEPLDVQFECLTPGTVPESLTISFNDSTPSSPLSVVEHTYSENGIYFAECEVLNEEGVRSSDSIRLAVLDSVPVVDFNWDPLAPGIGEDVLFTSEITFYDALTGYLWNFSDGSTSIEEAPSHAFVREGEYNVTLTVRDDDGSSVSHTETIVVGDSTPVVNLVTNVTEGLEPLTVNYTCNVGGGNAPFEFGIDFGDDETSDEPSGSHTYSTPGVYEMECFVTDRNGDPDSDFVEIEVIDNPPVVDLVAEPEGGSEGADILFTCNVDGGNAPLEYLINFDDLTSTENSEELHTFPLAGTYNVSCRVTDADADVGIDWELIEISDNVPVVALDVNVTEGLEPLTVNYSCDVGGGNAPYTYDIDFGDGRTGDEPTGEIVYFTPDNYTITCTVTDSDGDSDVDSVDIEVLNNVPAVTLVADPAAGAEGVTVDFDCFVSGGNEPLTALIEFGDGESAVGFEATHTYPLEGNYNATCTVTDDDFDSGIDAAMVTVDNNIPVVNLIPNVSRGVEALSVEFNCSLVGDGNAPFTYSINFGDGSPSSDEPVVSHTYDTNGTYDATCIVTDADDDDSLADTATIIVDDSEPDTSFTYSPLDPVEGEVVSFDDTSSAYDGIVAWEWDFGDGNTSTEENPTHTYFVAGDYLVFLTTRDADGSETSTAPVLITVGNNAPVVSLSVSDDEAREDEAINPTISCSVSSGGNAPFTYLVFYGDGESTTSALSTHTYDEDGLYPVTCEVTDNDGDVGRAVHTVNITDTEPTADFTFAPLNPREGQEVSFTDTSTAYDTLVSWAWDFDNNGVVDSVEQNATYIFPAASLYVVNLTVTDSDGSSDSVIRSIPVNISVGAPVIYDVEANPTNISANITWGTDQRADSLVEYGLDEDLGSAISSAALVFSHSIILPGLTPNTTYYYNVTSCNVFDDCSTDGPFNFSTLPDSGIWPGDTTPPAPVSNLRDTARDGDSIAWSWNNPADLDFDHVELWLNGTFVLNVSIETFEFTGLDFETVYEVEVITVDTTGNRNFPGETDSAMTSAGVSDTTPPGNVTGLAESGSGADWIEWSWTNPADLDFDHVELWLNGTFIQNISSPVNSYNFSELSSGTVYEVLVITVDAAGNRNTPGISDTASTLSTDTAPVVSISAVPSSGYVPLAVQFDSNVSSGNPPFSYEWDFDNDGAVDSAEESPLYIFNSAGTFTSVLTVTDSDGDSDSANMTITVLPVVHDISVDSINHSEEAGTVYLNDALEINATVSNQGSVAETFNVSLEIDSVVVGNQQLTLAAGASAVVSFDVASAAPAGDRIFVVRAAPVVGETDLADQSRTAIVRVWSVDDIVDESTRYVVYWAGTAYVPIRNAYVDESFTGLRVELTSDTALITPPLVQYVDLGPSGERILMWTVAAVPGNVLTVIEGNNEVMFSTIV